MCAESQREVIPSRRQWEWVMVLKAFFDDSGSDPSSHVYVLGGVMLPKEWWGLFSEEWRAVLDKAPAIEYYKGSEVWSDKPESPFAHLTPNQRKQKVNALAITLSEYHPAAFSCRVDWNTFEEFRNSHSLKSPGDDPYFYLFFNALVLVHKYGIKHSNLSRAEFCFDNQNKIGERVRDWYAIFRSRCPLQMSEWLADEPPQFGDEKLDLPLQAADMFAWHQRRELTGTLSRHHDISNWGLISQYLSKLEMRIDELEAMAVDLAMIV